MKYQIGKTRKRVNGNIVETIAIFCDKCDQKLEALDGFYGCEEYCEFQMCSMCHKKSLKDEV